MADLRSPVDNGQDFMQKIQKITRHLEGMKRRLKNPDVPEERKRRIKEQEKHLEKNVLPRYQSIIQNDIPVSSPLWKI